MSAGLSVVITSSSGSSVVASLVFGEVVEVVCKVTATSATGDDCFVVTTELNVVGGKVVNSSVVGTKLEDLFVVIGGSVVGAKVVGKRVVGANVVVTNLRVVEVEVVATAPGSGGQWSYRGQHSPGTYSGSQSKRNLQSASAQVIELP